MGDCMKIIIGNDHNGYELKKEIVKYLKNNNYYLSDAGCDSVESVDNPLIAKKVCDEVLTDEDNIGILICGTGIGMSIAANKVKGIRCAKVSTEEEAALSKLHNNANVMAISGRIDKSLAIKFVDKFINTNFSNEERHIRRNNQIDNM